MTGEGSRWSWRLLAATGSDLDATTPAASSRFDAEGWLGENWRRLAAEGAAHAVLVRDGSEVTRVPLRGFDE